MFPSGSLHDRLAAKVCIRPMQVFAYRNNEWKMTLLFESLDKFRMRLMGSMVLGHFVTKTSKKNQHGGNG